MKRLRWLVPVIAAAALFTAGGARAQAGDYASGEGFWQGSGTFAPGGIGFEGIDGPGFGAEGEGEFDYRNIRGKGFHARVVCVDIEGNSGFLGLVEERADGTRGKSYDAYVEDNGPGSGGRTVDRFNMAEGDPDCDDDNNLRGSATAVRGDIFVVDSRFPAPA